jgi:hypothetical protein
MRWKNLYDPNKIPETLCLDLQIVRFSKFLFVYAKKNFGNLSVLTEEWSEIRIGGRDL